MPAPSALLDLQALDVAIDRLTSRRRVLEGGDAIVAARQDADAAERELGELGLQMDALDRDAAKLEHEVDSLGQKEADERARMSDGSVANARELEVMGREVENLGKRISDREDQLLVLMEQREAIERTARDVEQRAAELRTHVDHALGDAANELAQVIADLQTRSGERAALASRLDADLLELYEDLRAHKKGVGAAALVDGVCHGCHETLSAVDLDRVKHAQGIARCEHCRRILVL